MQNRNYNIDILRVLCCFLVVCIHIAPLYSSYIQLGVTEQQKYILLSIESFVRVGMPVFFAISGMFILNKEIKSLTAFYKKRLIAIVIPFIFASTLHFWIKSYYNGSDFSIADYLRALRALSGSIYISDHFWFVYAILGIYIIAPIFSFLICKLDSAGSYLVLNVIALYLFLSNYISPFIHGMFLPEIGTWLLYFISGGLITKIKLKSYVFVSIFCFGYLLTLLAAKLNYNHFLPMDLNQYDSGINMYIFSMSLAGIFWSSNFHIKGVSARIVSYVSSTTYMIYLLHIAVQMVISHVLPTYWYVGNAFSYTISMSLLIMFVSFLISAFLNWLVIDRLIKLANKIL